MFVKWRGIDFQVSTHTIAEVTFPIELYPDLSTGTDRRAIPCVWLQRRLDDRASSSDLEIAGTSRSVELHVQSQGESGPSYAQTLRGAAVEGPPGSAPRSGTFSVAIPLSQAYPNWEFIKLAFVSPAPSSPGGCHQLHRLELVPATSPDAGPGPADPDPESRSSGGGGSHDPVGDDRGASAVQPEWVAAARGAAGAEPLAHIAAARPVGSQLQQMRELLQQAASSAPPMGSASTPAAAAANANLGLAATLARSLLAASAPPPRPPPPGPAPPGSAPPEFPLTAAGPITTSNSGVLGGGGTAVGTGLAASGSFASAAQAPVGPAAPALTPASASLFGGLPGGGALAAAMSALYDMSARIQRIEAHVLGGGGGGAPGQGGQPPSLSGPDQPVTRVAGDGAGGADGTVAGASGSTRPSQAGPPQQERVGTEERLVAVAEQLAAALPALAGSVGRLEAAAAAQAAATAQLSAAVAEVNRRLDVLSAEREAGPQRGMHLDCADSCVAEEGQ